MENFQNLGEISLSHFGVLFLDELTEFNKNTLEILRAPLEDKNVSISRVNSSVVYPCNFMFVASMNPCPCGYYGSTEKPCACTLKQIKKYINKISGPLLDRIDIHIEVRSIKYNKINTLEKPESSSKIRQRVNSARLLQQKRYKKHNIFSNSDLTTSLLEKFCSLDDKSQKLLQNAFERLNLSARAYAKILKVARTIADLEEAENIQESHVAEAIQYRSLDRKYWE